MKCKHKTKNKYIEEVMDGSKVLWVECVKGHIKIY